MKWKAVLILLAVLAAVAILVGALVYGGMKNNEKVAELPLPGNEAAKQYVLNQGLLTEVTKVDTLQSGGPVFLMLSGKDASGKEKVVWVAGRDSSIKDYGSAHLQDGVSRDEILQKVKEKKISEDQIYDMYVAPRDYLSGQLVWFVREKGDKKHMLWYDFHTAEFVWEGYEDPTAWRLRK